MYRTRSLLSVAFGTSRAYTSGPSASSRRSATGAVVGFGAVLAVIGVSWERIKSDAVLMESPESKKAPMISMSDVGMHRTANSTWVVINGEVWDVTSFLDKHPGGSKAILTLAGQDASDAFNAIHPPKTIERSLSPEQKVGLLDPSTAVSNAAAQAEKDRLQRERDSLPPVERVLSLTEMEEVAQRVLSQRAKTYYNGGAETESALQGNLSSFKSCRLIPRALRDVSTVVPQTTLFGCASALPIYISPAANALLGHPDAEFNLTRGAARTGIIQAVSASSALPLEDLLGEKKAIQESDGIEMGMMYQVYVTKDRDFTALRMAKARRGGVKGFIVTVDVPVNGNRESDDRDKGVSGDASPGIRMEPFTKYGANHDAAFCWDDMPWLKEAAGGLPLYLKGIASVEDVRMAKRNGIAGVILSNHGGRQLDYMRSGFDTLQAIHKEDPNLVNELEVYVDGGVRRGTDVIKALCLGARGVGLGRPFLYAQSAYGELGVIRAVRILEEELVMGMRLMGAKTLADLTPDMLERVPNL